jgi:hypothetical protein
MYLSFMNIVELLINYFMSSWCMINLNFNNFWTLSVGQKFILFVFIVIVYTFGYNKNLKLYFPNSSHACFFDYFYILQDYGNQSDRYSHYSQ